MPNQKLKSENYENLGGINSKVSPYNNGPQEFLNLVNWDFQTPGALSQRWGTANYFSQTFSAPVNTIFEFSKTTGASWMIVGHSGGIWYGATTGTLSGASFALQSSNSTFTGLVGGWFFSLLLEPANGYAFNIATEIPWGSNDKFVGVAPVTQQIDSQPIGSRPTDFIAFQNIAYGANGSQFMRFNGSSFTNFGLPLPITIGQTLIGASSGSLHFRQDGFYTAFFGSFVNDSNQEGPRFPISYVDHRSANGTTLVSIFGSTLITVQAAVHTPLSFGFSAINVYAFSYAGSATFSSIRDVITSNSNLYFLGRQALSGSTISVVSLGTTFGGHTAMNLNYGPLSGTANEFQGDERCYGLTLTASASLPLGYFRIGSDNLPSFAEVFANQLFLAGMPSAPSTIRYSEIGGPENLPIENSIEVRTNDGDQVTGIKTFGSRLIITKRNSTHYLTGDNPDNFSLTEVTSDYGALNNRCLLTYGDLYAQLDRKGLVGFNGAAVNLLSFRIQPIVDRINFAAGVTHACMVHDKVRNQILIGVPLDGATFNNTTLVFDYFANAWTQYSGFNPSAFSVAQGTLSNRTVFVGGQSGTVSYFGESFLSDAGQGFTLIAKTRFHAEMGQSTEKQWRRLWLNVIDPLGVTVPVTVNFYKNYGASVALTRTMYSTPFQSRIDFGIPAKSLAVEFIKSSFTGAPKIPGYALGYRFQRDV